MFQHAANFAVLAFGQGHFHPAIAPGAAFHIGDNPPVMHPVHGDAFGQFFELVLRNRAEHAGAVGARHAGGGQFELAFEFAIIGEQQQPFGAEIEPPNRHLPRGARRQRVDQCVVDGWPACRITLGSDQAGRLVEREQPGAFGRGNGLFVHRHPAQTREDGGRSGQHHAVQLDPPILDHPLHFAATGDTRAGEQFGDTVTAGRSVRDFFVIRHSKPLAGTCRFIYPPIGTLPMRAFGARFARKTF